VKRDRVPDTPSYVVLVFQKLQEALKRKKKKKTVVAGKPAIRKARGKYISVVRQGSVEVEYLRRKGSGSISEKLQKAGVDDKQRGKKGKSPQSEARLFTAVRGRFERRGSKNQEYAQSKEGTTLTRKTKGGKNPRKRKS